MIELQAVCEKEKKVKEINKKKYINYAENRKCEIPVN